MPVVLVTRFPLQRALCDDAFVRQTFVWLGLPLQAATFWCVRCITFLTVAGDGTNSDALRKDAYRVTTRRQMITVPLLADHVDIVLLHCLLCAERFLWNCLLSHVPNFTFNTRAPLPFCVQRHTPFNKRLRRAFKRAFNGVLL